MNWDDPEQRLALLERLGADAYNKAFEDHLRATTIVTINDHGIRLVSTRFGMLYAVDGAQRAFLTLAEAETFAAQNPKETTP